MEKMFGDLSVTMFKYRELEEIPASD